MCRYLPKHVQREGTSSDTQGQIVGVRESLNGRENMARRKEKNGEKSPWGQCLTRPVPNCRRHSAFWLGRKTQKFSGTNQKAERRRQFGTGLARHCPQGLFLPFVTFLCAIFPFRLDFLSPPLSPPGSPRMGKEGLGAKEAKATCTARENNMSEVIDLSKSIVKLLKPKTTLWLVIKTTGKHSLVFNLT